MVLDTMGSHGSGAFSGLVGGDLAEEVPEATLKPGRCRSGWGGDSQDVLTAQSGPGGPNSNALRSWRVPRNEKDPKNKKIKNKIGVLLKLSADFPEECLSHTRHGRHFVCASKRHRESFQCCYLKFQHFGSILSSSNPTAPGTDTPPGGPSG